MDPYRKPAEVEPDPPEPERELVVAPEQLPEVERDPLVIDPLEVKLKPLRLTFGKQLAIWAPFAIVVVLALLLTGMGAPLTALAVLVVGPAAVLFAVWPIPIFECPRCGASILAPRIRRSLWRLRGSCPQCRRTPGP